MGMNLILASASPRRAALLDQLSLKYEIYPADIDEHILLQEDVISYTKRLAENKARKVLNMVKYQKNCIILGSDTSIEFNNQIIGKPVDFLDAKKTWTKIMGHKHYIYTAFCLMTNDRVVVEVVRSSAIMQPLTDYQMHDYWQTGEPKDKAGGYAIQGIGAQFISYISGSYSAIMGLPLFELSKQLRNFGINTLRLDK